MKNKKIIRLFTAALAVALCATAFAVPAFAGGGEGEPYYTETAGTEADPAEDAEAPEVTVTDEEDPAGDDSADNNTEVDGDTLDQITELMGGLGTVTVTEDGILFTPDTEKWETHQTGTVTTCGGNLNVRTGARLDNTAFTQLPNGTVVDVIGRDGDWVKILLPARVGYVYGSYLTVTDAADSTVSIGGITLPFDEKELADLWQLLVGSMTGGSDALTPDGNLTLIDDIGSSTKAGKQFITLESKNGNVFYMIIDRDDEGEETVHFLNQVDEADLMALTGEEETPAVCSCTTKCVAGAVNTSCPVCAVNMTECVGKEAKPEVPAEPTEPAAEEPEKKSGVGGILVVLLIVALGGGAAFYIFKQKKAKPQTKGSADLDDYDYGEDEYEFEPYEDEPEQDTTEDTDA